MSPLLIVELRLRSESESWGKQGTVCDLWRRSWNLRSSVTGKAHLPLWGKGGQEIDGAYAFASVPTGPTLLQDKILSRSSRN